MPAATPERGPDPGPRSEGLDWRELNRAWWDERVPLHVASDLYDVDSFRAGRDTVEPFEAALLGDVTGQRLAHLQCHFGLDTMSWARNHGASAVGLDFSAPAVEAANALATELAIDARFVCADVYDAVTALGGERFDVVYTGLGAINWLPDLGSWAKVVAGLLRPGGRLLLSEFHPFAWVFGDEGAATDPGLVEHDYFDAAGQVFDDGGGTYADLSAVTANDRTVEHQHPLSEILGSLLGAGLTLEAFEEYDHTLYPRFGWLERRGRTFHQPAGNPRIPLMFALLARMSS